MAGARKYGDWNALNEWQTRMKSDKWKQTLFQELDALGGAIKGTVRGHIKSQDLPWKPLKPITIRLKGHDTIYVHTSDLYNKIQKRIRSMTDETILLVVAPIGKHESGMDTQTLAKMLEYGTSKMSARPLWRPSFEEVGGLPELKRLINLGAKFSFTG